MVCLGGTVFVLHLAFEIATSAYLRDGARARWHHELTEEDKADRDYFRNPHPVAPIHLTDFNGFAANPKTGIQGLGYEHAGPISMESLSQPAQPDPARFKMADPTLPLKEQIKLSWLGAYGEQGSMYGRGVKDFWSPSYGTFGDHNYGPIGAAYQTKIGFGARHGGGLPWNYSQPWDSGSPHPIWPVPPSEFNTSLYNPDAIKWMTAPNMNLRDPIQPIGAGYGAQPVAVPQQQPIKVPAGYRSGEAETLMRFRGGQKSVTKAGAALRFRARQMLAGAEGVGVDRSLPKAPTVFYKDGDPLKERGTLYVNASSKEGAFPFDRTGNLASAPYTGYPAQWASSPYPYGPAGEMPGTGGNPEPKPSWFWRMGGIPKTLPGYSRGAGAYYTHGGAFHPHAPSRTMQNHMSFWPGNVGLMTGKHPNYVPIVDAQRAAAMVPPSTGREASGMGVGAAGPSLNQDHYNAVPMEPIPPPGVASQTVPAMYKGGT